jgi:hypothetical protein
MVFFPGFFAALTSCFASDTSLSSIALDLMDLFTTLTGFLIVSPDSVSQCDDEVGFVEATDSGSCVVFVAFFALFDGDGNELPDSSDKSLATLFEASVAVRVESVN